MFSMLFRNAGKQFKPKRAETFFSRFFDFSIDEKKFDFFLLFFLIFFVKKINVSGPTVRIAFNIFVKLF